MGSSKSKQITPNNPLQEMQLKEMLRDRKLKKQEKERKTLRKLQEKNIKKQQHLRKQQKSKSAEPSDNHLLTSPQPSFELSQQEYEMKVQKTLKYQLDNDLSGFIVNQAILSLQFFENFEKEISASYEYLWKQKENQLNQKLEDHSILMANALDAAVERRVKYKPLHGLEKHHPQLLQTQTMYVVFENIDIARPNEANYDSLTPICKVDLDTDFYKTTPCNEAYAPFLRQAKWKGYVRLKLRDSQSNMLSKSSEKSSNPEEEMYFNSNSTTSSHGRRKDEFRYSSSSGYTSTTDYGYAYITYLNSHRPLCELTMSNINESTEADLKVLPESCIANFQDYIEISNDDDEEDDEEHLEFDIEDLTSFVPRFNIPQIKYLNSKEFMCYFGDLLRNRLAEKLNFPENELEYGTYRGASIHTQTYEIIPAIHVAHNAQNWPDCAFQFKRRTRPTRINPLTNKQFQWPTPEMIKRVESFGFHVIPLGYTPKKQRNPFREIEWKVIFPKAERFLETTLTNTQIKVFMITKALMKAFVEPEIKDNAFVFTVDHLRTHLFWECERNYVTWPEEFLGDVLIRFIKTYMLRLREKSLPDFFIQERNHFESIPEFYLVKVHSVLVEIVSNPIPHILIALRNLYFVDDFFPKMDLKKIYNNLVQNNLIKLKALSKSGQCMSILDVRRCSTDLNDDKDVREIPENSQQLKAKAPFRRRTLKMKQNIEIHRRMEYERHRKSVDSIDIEFIFGKNVKDSDKNQGLENLRRTNILEVILDHLINMAEACTHKKENRSLYIARIYLNQAKRLCELYNNLGCDTGAIEYISHIDSIESQISTHQDPQDNLLPPALPIRPGVDVSKGLRPQQSGGIHRILENSNALEEQTRSKPLGNFLGKKCHDAEKQHIEEEKANRPVEVPKSIKFAKDDLNNGQKRGTNIHKSIKCKKEDPRTDHHKRGTEVRKSIKFAKEDVCLKPSVCKNRKLSTKRHGRRSQTDKKRIIPRTSRPQEHNSSIDSDLEESESNYSLGFRQSRASNSNRPRPIVIYKHKESAPTESLKSTEPSKSPSPLIIYRFELPPSTEYEPIDSLLGDSFDSMGDKECDNFKDLSSSAIKVERIHEPMNNAQTTTERTSQKVESKNNFLSTKLQKKSGSLLILNGIQNMEISES